MTDSTPTLAETPADSEGGILAPYSGEETPCPKCGNERARTVWRPATGVRCIVRSNGRPTNGPLPERLERECERCDFQWDEALCPPGPGMTVEALAHAVDNATPYPVDLHPEVCTFMARSLLDCLHVTARPDHPLWQYDAGRPGPGPAPQPAESCPAADPAPEEGPPEIPVTVEELATVLHADPPEWAFHISLEYARHIAKQIWLMYVLTRRPGVDAPLTEQTTTTEGDR